MDDFYQLAKKMANYPNGHSLDTGPKKKIVPINSHIITHLLSANLNHLKRGTRQKKKHILPKKSTIKELYDYF